MKTTDQIINKAFELANLARKNDTILYAGEPIIGLWWCTGYPYLGQTLGNVVANQDLDESELFNNMLCELSALQARDSLQEFISKLPKKRTKFMLDALLMAIAYSMSGRAKKWNSLQTISVVLTIEVLLWVGGYITDTRLSHLVLEVGSDPERAKATWKTQVLEIERIQSALGTVTKSIIHDRVTKN